MRSPREIKHPGLELLAYAIVGILFALVVHGAIKNPHDPIHGRVMVAEEQR